MAIIHFWRGANFGGWERIAIAVADVERRPMQLPAVLDAHQHAVHPQCEILAAKITPHAMPDTEFNPLNTLITIESMPEFAFTPYTFTCGPEGARITAIPYTEHMRRSCLPDWYVPTQEQMQ